jgi:hypothetical protein
MNSPFANIFLAIQSYVAALTNNNVPLIRYIDQDKDQVHMQERPAVDFPFIFIEFDRWTFENAGENIQTAEGDIIITLGFAPYSDTSQVTPEQYKEMGLSYYDIEFQLHKALQGWVPSIAGSAIPYVGTLTRTSSVKDNRRPDIRMRKITYRCAFEDYSTQTPYNTVEATLNVGYEDDGI